MCSTSNGGKLIKHSYCFVLRWPLGEDDLLSKLSHIHNFSNLEASPASRTFGILHTWCLFSWTFRYSKGDRDKAVINHDKLYKESNRLEKRRLIMRNGLEILFKENFHLQGDTMNKKGFTKRTLHRMKSEELCSCRPWDINCFI